MAGGPLAPGKYKFAGQTELALHAGEKLDW
jgi:hypothetical protein